MTSFLYLLVRLFPAPFREQFEADMLEQIRLDYQQAAAHGRIRTAGFTILTAFDLARSAIAEHWNPTWPETPMPTNGERAMAGMINPGEWASDVRQAVRSLRRSPGFAIITIGTLGLAIGANAGIFSVVDTVLLNPLPFPDSDQLVYIAGTAPGSDLPDEFGLSPEFFVQYKEESRLLADVATWQMFTASMRADDRTERIWMSATPPSLYSTLRATPILGRLPVAEDESRVVVISHGLWATWFGSDPGVIGQAFEIAGDQRTVIGVMGEDFWFPDRRVMLWISNPVRPEAIQVGRFGLPFVGRMARGATPEAVASELKTLGNRLPERFGGSARYAKIIEQHRPVVRPLTDQLFGGVSRALWVLLGSVAIVLLIACANVANLFMVRSERRGRDLAVRRAVGAGRYRLIRSQMSEAIVIAGVAGIVAVALAWATVPLFLQAAPPDIPRLDEVAIKAPTLLFTLGASMLAALLCGLGPAVRSSSPDMNRLRDGGRLTRRRHWARDGLVVAQTALALVLLIGSGLLIRSFWELRHVDPGYETKDIFTFQIAPEAADLDDGPSYARFHTGFMERIAALQGVESVGLIENVPLNEGTASGRFRSDRAGVNEEDATLLNYTYAGGPYFSTMGISLQRGRAFEPTDHTSAPGNVVISRSAADALWPGEDPLGRRIQRVGQDRWDTVVGVVEDVMQYGFRDTPQALVYYPLAGPTPTSWVISTPAYVVKTKRAETIAPEIRALVKEVAPNAPMYRVFTMAGLASDSMVQLSFTMLTLGIASLLALILGAVGLYGVLSYIVAERTQEIGVRMALGAEARELRLMVVVQGVRVVVVGVAIGAVIALLSTRALGSLLFGVAAIDLLTFIGMSVTMVGVGMLASYVPARRASNVDPIRSLRGS